MSEAEKKLLDMDALPDEELQNRCEEIADLITEVNREKAQKMREHLMS